ncbi:MAG: hypothetical protein ABL974_00840 [Prosthecobacter sp.]
MKTILVILIAAIAALTSNSVLAADAERKVDPAVASAVKESGETNVKELLDKGVLTFVRRLDTDPTFSKAVVEAVQNGNNAQLVKLVAGPKGSTVEGNIVDGNPKAKDVTVRVCIGRGRVRICITVTVGR